MVTDSKLQQIWRNPAGPDLGYAEFGDPLGVSVLFFHGWPGCRLQAGTAHEPARVCGLRLIALDRPGIGLSEAQSARGINDWPMLVRGFADHLGLKRFHLVAVSGGCPYALATAAALPERTGKTVIICGAPPLAEFRDWSDLFWVFRVLARTREVAPFLEYPVMWMAKPWTQLMPGDWPVRFMSGWVPAADRRALNRAIHITRVAAMMREAYRRPEGQVMDGRLYLNHWGFDPGVIRTPVRFWHGDADASLPPGKTRWLADRIPGAQFDLVPGEGHYSLPLDHMTRFLQWLAAK